MSSRNRPRLFVVLVAMLALVATSCGADTIVVTTPSLAPANAAADLDPSGDGAQTPDTGTESEGSDEPDTSGEIDDSVIDPETFTLDFGTNSDPDPGPVDDGGDSM